MAKNDLILGTLILTLASFITRILGFLFRIYMSNVMGAEALGLYQLVFPIFILAWTISGSGISVAVSKLVSVEIAKKEHANSVVITKVAILVSLIIGLFLSFIIYLFSDFISASIIKEPQTNLSLKYLSLSIPFMAVSSSIKGYFYGTQQMKRPAISQVLEQLSRMIGIYIFGGFFISKGLEYSCALAVLGLTAGEIVCFLYIYYTYKKDTFNTPYKPRTLLYSRGLISLVTLAAPITFNKVITSVLQSFENILIPIKLQESGLTNHQALSVYGQFTGMTMPLIFFPSMLTMSLATALIPAVSHAKESRNNRSLQLTVSKTIQFTFLIGIGASTLFMTLPNEIAILFYNQDAVGNMLYALSFICPFFYLQSTLLGILNGLGRQVETLVISILSSVISITIIYFYVPQKGLFGFIAAIIISSSFSTLSYLTSVLGYTSIPIDIINWVIKPGISGLSSGLITRYVLSNYLIPYYPHKLSTFIAILLLGILYLMFSFITGGLKKDDIILLKS